MSVKASCWIEIDRAPAEVASFLFDPARDVEWCSAIASAHALQSGPIKAGHWIDRKFKFMGRTFECKQEVVAFEPDTLLEVHSEHPFPLTLRYDLEPSMKGTLVHITATGDPKGFFALAKSAIEGKVKEVIQNDISHLKMQVEDA